MDSLKLATFFHTRVTNTIAQKAYIKSITISFDHRESFGNEYVSISYGVEPNDKFYDLSAQERESVSETFEESPYYIFSLSTRSENRYNNQKQILKRLLEFKYVYLSLTSYVTTQLETHLPADVFLKIKGIDYWPKLNYAEKYFARLYERSGDYKDLLSTAYEADVFQYGSLHELSISSKEKYHKQKEFFKVTDHELASLHLLNLNSVRRILLSHQVPVKVTGGKTIDKIHIHVPACIEALQKEYTVAYADETGFRLESLPNLKQLIEYMYNNYSIEEKGRIIEQQRSAFIKDLPIQEGDVLELTDGRLVVTESIMVNDSNDIDIQYCILKNNLQKSVRKRTIKFEQVSFYLKLANFEEHKKHVPIMRLSLLKRWMKKRKNKVAVSTFQSDLARQI
jgi:hypothetical protein